MFLFSLASETCNIEIIFRQLLSEKSHVSIFKIKKIFNIKVTKLVGATDYTMRNTWTHLPKQNKQLTWLTNICHCTFLLARTSGRGIFLLSPNLYIGCLSRLFIVLSFLIFSFYHLLLHSVIFCFLAFCFSSFEWND